MKSQRLNIIHERLTQALNPSFLEIIDESEKHIGHAGAQNGAGHYALIIASVQFSGQSLIENHRLIYKALESLIPNEIHALKISIMKN